MLLISHDRVRQTLQRQSYGDTGSWNDQLFGGFISKNEQWFKCFKIHFIYVNVLKFPFVFSLFA